MNHESVNPTQQTSDVSKPVQEKRPYTKPELVEHGNAAEVTLQTMFGSFSP